MPDGAISQRESTLEAPGDRRSQAVDDGRADIAARRILTPERIDEWIATLGTAYETPVPQSSRPPP
jgi:predicted transcriptional regulator